jgi:hypothetical protein
MRKIAFSLLTGVMGLGVMALVPCAPAQVGVDVSIGAAPECPYGYYDVAPYSCAPAGYYGPEWFNGGVFVGAGPWFHGDHDFHGHVDNRFHPDHGYRGTMPARGEKADESRRVDAAHFNGNEVRDGRGHVVNEKR